RWLSGASGSDAWCFSFSLNVVVVRRRQARAPKLIWECPHGVPRRAGLSDEPLRIVRESDTGLGTGPRFDPGLWSLRQQSIEDVPKKASQRAFSFVSLRPQQRPLPAIEHDPRQFLGIRICGQFLLRYRLLDHLGDPLLPARERSADPLSQLRTLRRDLQA